VLGSARISEVEARGVVPVVMKKLVACSE